MSKISLIFVLRKIKNKKFVTRHGKDTNKIRNNHTFLAFFSIVDVFNRILSQTIDKTLGLRSKFFGYQYSEIIRSLMCIYFCGGTCIVDVRKHLMPYLSQHPKQRTCSSDTILRAIEGLTEI